MTKNHLKRVNSPKTWNVPRRTTVFITRPNPGAHNLEMALPLVVVLRDNIKIVTNMKETRSLLLKSTVLINGRKVTDVRAPVGFMDVISFATDKHYRLVLSSKGKLTPIEISSDEAKNVPLRIENKHKIAGKKTQLNLFGGRNINVDKDEYKTGDTILVAHDNKIGTHFAFGKGMSAVLIGGQHIGSIGTVEDVRENNIIFKDADGNVFETLKSYAYIVGKDKVALKIAP